MHPPFTSTCRWELLERIRDSLSNFRGIPYLLFENLKVFICRSLIVYFDNCASNWDRQVLTQLFDAQSFWKKPGWCVFNFYRELQRFVLKKLMSLFCRLVSVFRDVYCSDCVRPVLIQLFAHRSFCKLAGMVHFQFSSGNTLTCV